MKEDFCDYNTSRMVKELGFKEECIAYYWANKDTFHWTIPPYRNHNELPTRISVPSWQQIEKWLWEEHKLVLSHTLGNVKEEHSYVVYILHNKDGIYYKSIATSESCTSPIMAKIQSIIKAVEHLHKNI